MPVYAAFAQSTTLSEELIHRTAVGSAEDVALLVAKVGSPRLVDNQGRSLLYIAASRVDGNALDVVKVLVKAGADVNYDGGRKLYPIFAAVQSSNLEVISYLIDKGASIYISDLYGVTLRDFVILSSNQKVREIIEEKIEKDSAYKANARSAETYYKVQYEIAYHACAYQYFSFYYKSEQDDIPEEIQDKTLAKHKEAIEKNATHLMYYFKKPAAMINAISLGARDAMKAELEALISNRWRRKHGVGSDGDMPKRCEIIAQRYPIYSSGKY